MDHFGAKYIFPEKLGGRVILGASDDDPAWSIKVYFQLFIPTFG
jgi:hypothetical protein